MYNTNGVILYTVDVAMAWKYTQLLDLLLLRIKAFRNFTAQWRLYTSQGRYAEYDNWNEDKEGNEEGGDERRSENLISFEDATIF